MSVQLDILKRNAETALNNLIQLAQEEGESVDLYLDYKYDDEGNTHLEINPLTRCSSSYDC